MVERRIASKQKGKLRQDKWSQWEAAIRTHRCGGRQYDFSLLPPAGVRLQFVFNLHPYRFQEKEDERWPSQISSIAACEHNLKTRMMKSTQKHPRQHQDRKSSAMTEAPTRIQMEKTTTKDSQQTW